MIIIPTGYDLAHDSFVDACSADFPERPQRTALLRGGGGPWCVRALSAPSPERPPRTAPLRGLRAQRYCVVVVVRGGAWWCVRGPPPLPSSFLLCPGPPSPALVEGPPRTALLRGGGGAR